MNRGWADADVVAMGFRLSPAMRRAMVEGRTRGAGLHTGWTTVRALKDRGLVDGAKLIHSADGRYFDLHFSLDGMKAHVSLRGDEWCDRHVEAHQALTEMWAKDGDDFARHPRRWGPPSMGELYLMVPRATGGDEEEEGQVTDG